MKENKSIDGLSTRSSKKPANPVVKAKTPTSKKAKTLTVAAPASSVLDDIIDEESLTIDVKSSSTETPTSKETSSSEQLINDFLTPTSPLNLDSQETEEKSSKSTDSKKSKKDKKSKKNQKVKKPKSKAKKITSIIIIVIVFLIIGFAIWAVLWGNDLIAKITGGKGSIFDLGALMSETYDPLETDANGRTNILAFGTSGYNMDGDEGNGIHDGAQLTDSIMLISLNQETGDIAMLSLPRDLKAKPTCTATGKINEVYWCNNMKGDDEEAGATALMTEVGSILGVDFQYYAHLNWGSLISIVNILGGIEVTLDEDINDRYWTGAVYKAGVTYTLNGEEALGLARARHGTAGGDFSRGNSQQQILIGIKNKVFEKNLSLSDLLELATTLGDNLRTNFSISEMKTLAHLTSEFDFDSMRNLTLYPDYMTTGNINGISYVLPRAGAGNYGAIQKYVATKLSNDPRDYEEPTILVLNATETPGLAAKERTALEDAGYKIVDVDDAPEGDYTRGYILYSTHEKPGTEDLLEDHYSIDAWDYENMPEGISRDYDFVIILNPKLNE